MKSKDGTDYLVLWKYTEALDLNGQPVTEAYGTHAGGLKRGDRMFVVATHQDELYLLGAMRVARSGKDRANGKSLFGAFRIVPMKGLKWRLRFQGTSAVKLSNKTGIAMQVRARRRISKDSAALLTQLLSVAEKHTHKIQVQEGKTKQVTLSKRERSRTLRVLAISERKAICEICGFDFAKHYGAFAENCVEVHHIEGLARAGRRGVTNSLDDVLVVCPNCHRAIHQFRSPNDWKAFQRFCHLG
jgi:HNH endonuclease